MIRIDSIAYEVLLGNICKDVLSHDVYYIGQCAGCMCNCRCSCSGGRFSGFNWEVI